MTTVAAREWKSHVDPYASNPTIHESDGTISCPFCGSTKFRRSRVRAPDLREVLMLRLPLRCLRCNQRQYGYFATAMLALPHKTMGGRIARGDETWKAWTESEMNGHRSQRPLTTSQGTRATRLRGSDPAPQPPAPVQGPPAKPGAETDRHIW